MPKCVDTETFRGIWRFGAESLWCRIALAPKRIVGFGALVPNRFGAESLWCRIALVSKRLWPKIIRCRTDWVPKRIGAETSSCRNV